MLIRSALLTAVSATMLLLSACNSQLPISAPAQLQAASTARSTNGALLLIEEMAHGNPSDYDRIEAAFRVEIAKSTRPSLEKIIRNAVEAIHHHPMPGDINDHPVVRLVLASLQRYNQIHGKTLIPRLFAIFEIGESAPALQEAKIQQFQRSLATLPKIDANHLLQMFAEGFFDSEVPMNSPLHQRLVKLVEARLAARV